MTQVTDGFDNFFYQAILKNSGEQTKDNGVIREKTGKYLLWRNPQKVSIVITLFGVPGNPCLCPRRRGTSPVTDDFKLRIPALEACPPWGTGGAKR